MFGLFESKPVLEQSQSQWLFDVYAWSLDNFDANVFYNNTVLVLPTNEFFPGRVDSQQGMAELVFEKVKSYACISHWPTSVVDQSVCAIPNAPQIEVDGALRNPNALVDNSVADELRLQIPYNPEQVSNPEGMIASFAHISAHYLGQMAKQPPPGGPEFWPHVTEVLASYLGFGLMFANSAYTFKGSCASCYNPHANRNAYLSEQQSVYSLAIFAVLKNIPNKEVAPHLKGHLRGFYKRAVKEVKAREQDLAMLNQQQFLKA
ncbi:MAG: hypothetical protein GY744_16090 [Gammaproteobacteria bacterium]|nr:hypothetical protein [Gammaproteobacteria bacterium]